MTTFLFDTHSETAAVMPEAILNYLPFSPEPLSQWNDNTDILQFLYELNEGTGYHDYGKHLYQRGQSKFQDWIQRFTKYAQEALPAPAAVKQVIDVPNFADEPLFGQIAKYMIAWDGVISSVLSESAFFSIAHLLESEEDLNSSILLSAHLCYKQALQILRGFLENLVLPIHFCGNPQDYGDWRSNSYRVPPLRGRRGILKKLGHCQVNF